MNNEGNRPRSVGQFLETPYEVALDSYGKYAAKTDNDDQSSDL